MVSPIPKELQEKYAQEQHEIYDYGDEEYETARSEVDGSHILLKQTDPSEDNLKMPRRKSRRITARITKGIVVEKEEKKEENVEKKRKRKRKEKKKEEKENVNESNITLSTTDEDNKSNDDDTPPKNSTPKLSKKKSKFGGFTFVEDDHFEMPPVNMDYEQTPYAKEYPYNSSEYNALARALFSLRKFKASETDSEDNFEKCFPRYQKIKLKNGDIYYRRKHTAFIRKSDLSQFL